MDNKMTSLYRLLGRVFYALSAADGNLRPEEFETLKKAVKADWLHVEDSTDSFGTDSAFQIEIVFDVLFDEEIDIEGTIQEVKAFRQSNPSLFTPEMITRIMRTASKIANAVDGTNKSELTYLTQLEFALKG